MRYWGPLLEWFTDLVQLFLCSFRVGRQNMLFFVLFLLVVFQILDQGKSPKLQVSFVFSHIRMMGYFRLG